jgi:DNA-directed RNA polymerase specialized sigma24 family protein
MATANVRFEPQRDLLSQAIVESLMSWPETPRRVFIEIHYCGRSVEETARALGLRQGEVLQILQHCEFRLHRALKAFRDEAADEAGKDSHSALFFAS